MRELDKEVRRKAKLAKLAYKDKVEEKVKVGNAKDAWRRLNTMMGRKNKQQTVKTDDPRGFANELNRFDARFDVTDFSSERNNVCRSLLPSPVCVEEGDVISCFSRLKVPGPMASKVEYSRRAHRSWDQCLPVCFSCSWIACLFHARGS